MNTNTETLVKNVRLLLNEIYEFGKPVSSEIMEAVEDAVQKFEPTRYWQHDETGRVCESTERPSERWNEITRVHYSIALAYWIPDERVE